MGEDFDDDVQSEDESTFVEEQVESIAPSNNPRLDPVNPVEHFKQSRAMDFKREHA